LTRLRSAPAAGLGGLFCLTGLLLGRCMAGAPWVRSYPDIGERAFGGRGRVGVAVMLYAELYLTAVDLLILAGDNLAAIAPGFQPFGPGFGAQRAWTAVAAGLVLPSVWLRGLGALAWLSALGVVVSLGLTGLVAWEGAQLGFPFRRPPALRGGGALLALGLISFNFSGHALFPSLISAMRCRAEYPRVLGATFALVIAIYVAFATLGYAAFGDAAMCAPDQVVCCALRSEHWLTLPAAGLCRQRRRARLQEALMC
jgi:vesicular inhibitory amino acid transporter